MTAVPADPRPAVPARRREGLYFALRNGKLLAGLAVLVPLLVLAAAAPLIAGGDPNAYVAAPASPPSAGRRPRSASLRCCSRSATASG